MAVEERKREGRIRGGKRVGEKRKEEEGWRVINREKEGVSVRKEGL